MKKVCTFILIAIVSFMFNIFSVFAVELESIKSLCNIGETDSLLYSSEWYFKTTLMCAPGRKATTAGGKAVCTGTSISSSMTEGITVEIRHSELKYCPTSGCTGDDFSTSFRTTLDKLFSHANYANIFASDTNGISGVYTDSALKTLLEKGKCPNHVYIASSKSKSKIAFIFSSSKIDNAKELFENAGYTVDFDEQNGGDDLNQVNDTNYKNQVQKMKDNIKLFEDNYWGIVYSEDCSNFGKFGGIFHFGTGDYTENTTLLYYEKYKEEIFKSNPNYDFSEGDEIYNKYKNDYICAPKPAESAETGDLEKIELGKVTCATIFKNGNDYNSTWKILNISLKFMQYLGVILALVLSIVDFIKVVPTQDKDALKKATTKAVTRLIIAIVIFFVPIILDFILGLVGFNDPTCGLL